MKTATQESRAVSPIRLSGFGPIAVTWLLLLFLAWFVAGCKSSKSNGGMIPAKSPYASKLSAPELRDKLSVFYIEFVNSVEQATTLAATQTDDLALRERLLQSRLRMVRSCREAVFQRQPMAAFVDTWSLCIQLERYLELPEVRETFGDGVPVMREATHRLRGEIEELGRLFLKPNELADVKTKLEAFAASHPVSVQSEVLMPSADQAGSIPQFGWLIELPLTPFRAFEGVDQTAAAVHEFNYIASGFAQTVSEMPREMAWQSEVLLLQSRREMEGLLTDLDRRQTNTHATIEQARLAISETKAVMAELNRSLIDGKDTARAVTESINSLNALPGNVSAMMTQIHQLYPPDTNSPAEPPGRPFDILDYARAAGEIAVAATNLSGLLVEVQATVGANGLTERIKEIQTTADATIARTQKLTNHIALLVGLLILLFFGALLGYRVVSRRMPMARVPLNKETIYEP